MRPVERRITRAFSNTLYLVSGVQQIGEEKCSPSPVLVSISRI